MRCIDHRELERRPAESREEGRLAPENLHVLDPAKRLARHPVPRHARRNLPLAQSFLPATDQLVNQYVRAAQAGRHQHRQHGVHGDKQRNHQQRCHSFGRHLQARHHHAVHDGHDFAHERLGQPCSVAAQKKAVGFPQIAFEQSLGDPVVVVPDKTQAQPRRERGNDIAGSEDDHDDDAGKEEELSLGLEAKEGVRRPEQGIVAKGVRVGHQRDERHDRRDAKRLNHAGQQHRREQRRHLPALVARENREHFSKHVNAHETHPSTSCLFGFNRAHPLAWRIAGRPSLSSSTIIV